MKRENKSRYAILGILSVEPMSGYGIKQAFERGPTYFWRESYGQIYPILKRLVAEGLAEIRAGETGDKPGRKVHAITLAGRAVLREWLEAPTEASVVRLELLLKLFFGQESSPDKMSAQVAEYRDKLQARADTFVGVEAIIRGLKDFGSAAYPVYHLATLRYGQKITAAALEWCGETLEDLARLEGRRTNDSVQKEKR